MKTFLKILAGILILFIVIAIGLNLYFTNERLKNMIMPYVNEAVGRPVQVESMSITFFSTFPQPGLSIEHMSIPGETKNDTLLSLDELVAGVNLFSLMGDEIKVSEIKLDHPRFTYKIFKDSTTNIDFLLTDSTAADTSSGSFAIDIPYFETNDGYFGYQDQTSHTRLKIDDLDADISLQYADLIKSSVDLSIAGLTATIDSTNYVNKLPVSLSQKSTLDLNNEKLSLDKGTLSIRGLALNLSGTLANWSNTPKADLQFNSSSDDFGVLLRLVPPEYEKYTKDLESRGSLTIDGSLNGELGTKDLPKFDVLMKIKDGYLKNPDLPQPIKNIQLSAKLNNQLLNVDKLQAEAGDNNLSGHGQLSKPLEEDGKFSLNFKSNVNLSTVKDFYDLSTMDIEKLTGKLHIDAKADGRRDQPEKAQFNGEAQLSNGSLKYADVEKPFENIAINIKGDQSAVTIQNMNLDAAANTFSMKGIVNNPLKADKRSIDLTTKLKFDLATIKDFYPINEDTLAMKGLLTANATLRGKADQIEKAVQKGSVDLKNGYIDYKKIAKPIEDLTLQSTLDGPTLTVSAARFKTGENNLSATGTVKNYLSDDRIINLKITGNADLAQIQDYYDLKPTVTTLTGKADLNLRASGQISDPAKMAFDGNMTAKGINMEGKAIVQPVKNLNAELNLSPDKASLKSLKFDIGSSDISISGSLQNYMAYLKKKEDRKVTPHLEGTYKSKLLNLDELIDWDDTTSTEPIPINLPDLATNVQADISKLIVTGITMNNLNARASTTPKKINLEKAGIELFEGKANGSFVWNVPKPDHTNISFKGSLDSLQAKSFFREYKVLGKDSDFHKYISGAFSADIDYYTELNEFLEPIMKTSKMDGDFGMTKSRIQNHPVQKKLAALFNNNGFNNLALDKFKSTYKLNNNIFDIQNLQLTSGDIGLEMNGTQNLAKGDIDYQMKVLLPGKFKSSIASVITKQAADALTQDNGTIMVPLRATGSSEDPKIRPDKEAISPIVKKYLKDKAGNALKGLFGK